MAQMCISLHTCTFHIHKHNFKIFILSVIIFVFVFANISQNNCILFHICPFLLNSNVFLFVSIF